jgi:hypothetical protein
MAQFTDAEYADMNFIMALVMEMIDLPQGNTNVDI